MTCRFRPVHAALVSFLVVAAVVAAVDLAASSPLDRILAAGPGDGFAWGWLAQLCDDFGPRLSGSPAYDRAAAWAEASLRRAGFDRVWTEPVTVEVWERGVERARLTAPVDEPLAVAAFGRSVGTPAGGLEADVLAVTDFAELDARAAEAQGRIVLFDPPWVDYGTNVAYRGRGASAAARHGAVAVLVRSVTPTSLATLHTGVMRYDEGVPPIPAAAVTVEDAGRIHRLSARGVTVRVRLELGAKSLGRREQHNVVAELTGSERPSEIVVVAGHLDSWDLGPGAHDDGCGCAVAVGAARLLRTLALAPRRTVRVVLFAAEEFGGDGGDAYLATHADELDRHVAALEADSGCFAPDGFSVRADAAVVARLAALAEPLTPLGAGSVRAGWAGVDIGPIVERGVPGIGIRTKNARYFDYHHSAADTLDKIDPAELAANVTATAALLWAIADDPVSLRAAPAAATSESLSARGPG